LSESGFTQLKDLQDWISLGQIFILKIIRLPSIVSPLVVGRRCVVICLNHDFLIKGFA